MTVVLKDLDKDIENNGHIILGEKKDTEKKKTEMRGKEDTEGKKTEMRGEKKKNRPGQRRH